MEPQFLVSTRRWIASMSAFLFIGILAGCTTGKGPRFAQTDTAPPNDALIYFYRSGNESWVKSQKFQIYINGERVGALPYGCYFSRAVPPGKTVITSDHSGFVPSLTAYAVQEATKRPGEVKLDLMPGGVYFIKLEAANKFTYIVGNLSIEEKQIAVKEMQNTTLTP